MKRNIRKMNKFILFCIGLFIMLSACAPAPVETPTLTPSATRKVTPTRAITPTRTVTPTVIPTLPLEDALARIAELEETNGGCEYPCFWGITPGMTSFLEARLILEPLSERVVENQFQEGVFHFYLVGEQDIADYLANISIRPSGEIVEGIGYQNDLLLSDVLRLLGPPEEVYFILFSYWTVDPGYLIILNYPSRGVRVSFADEHGAEYVIMGNFVHAQICGRYVGLGSTGFSFWEPELPPLPIDPQILTFGTDEAVNIRDGLGMTPQEFYELYIDPESQACLIDPTPVGDLNDPDG